MTFFFNDTATTEIYTLSLHDALPIFRCRQALRHSHTSRRAGGRRSRRRYDRSYAGTQSQANRFGCSQTDRSEEHTSELQSRQYLVCRLLLEKKKNNWLIRDATRQRPI